ncbi:MAG: inosine/guanosine kinase, partial [Psychromonas sp.]
MKFPGQRKSKHYFPVENRAPLVAQFEKQLERSGTYVAGIDQTLVDIEAKVDQALLEKYELPKGNSTLMDDDKAQALYAELQQNNLIQGEYAGGTIGNTIHNYSVLTDDKSVLFGVMSNDIRVGNCAYRYLCDTSSKVNLNYLQPVDGPMGRCFTLISECGERTFAISKGSMDKVEPEFIDKTVVQNASALLISAYLMRAAEGDQITDSALTAIEYAKQANVPVVLTLGTHFLIEGDPQWWRNFIKENVTVLAMNEDEGKALTGFSDPLLASEAVLDLCDMVLTTAGSIGLFTAGYTEDEYKRETSHPLLPGAIPEFNRYEFSRPRLKTACKAPVKVYAYIPPYMGGPEKISNTNGAGDAALSALLHDLASNTFHKLNVPGSSKHKRQALCYSSFSQICKYANRV